MSLFETIFPSEIFLIFFSIPQKIIAQDAVERAERIDRAHTDIAFDIEDLGSSGPRKRNSDCYISHKLECNLDENNEPNSTHPLYDLPLSKFLECRYNLTEEILALAIKQGINDMVAKYSIEGRGFSF